MEGGDIMDKILVAVVGAVVSIAIAIAENYCED